MRISSGFWFAFLWWLVMLNSFSYACWPSGFPLFRKCLFSPSVHFLNGFLFFDVNCMSCLYMLDIRDYSIGHITCKYFLPFTRLSFHFVDGFLCCAKAFKFKLCPICLFLLLLLSPCLYLVWENVQILFFFTCSCPVSLTSYVFSSLYIPASLVIDQLSMNVRICFWALYSVFVWILYCFCYCSLIV